MDQLEQHCAFLNSLEWVRASGRPYGIGRTENDKRVVVRKGENASK